MVIKEYTVNDLKNELLTGDLWKYEEIPISKHKAISLIQNPRSCDDDIVLLVGIEDNLILGYLGIVPDKIYIGDEEITFGWLTTWFVDEKKVKAPLGMNLIFKAMKIYENNVGISDFNLRAKIIYEASRKFITLKESIEYKIFARFNLHELLTHRYPSMLLFKPVFHFIDNVLNMIVDLKNSFYIKSFENSKKCRLEYISQIDEETAEFIIVHRKNELGRRGILELNWILNYPWVIHAPTHDKISSRHKFLSTARNFYFLNIKVYDFNDNMIGFIILRLKDSEIRIPYFYFKENELPLLLKAIFYLINVLKADTFITRNADITGQISHQNLPHIYIRKNKRYAFTTKKFENIDFKKYHLQDGDGDNGFT